MRTCDHKWNDGPEEYAKTRVVLKFTEEGGEKFRLLRCDMCKRFIVESLELAKWECEEQVWIKPIKEISIADAKKIYRQKQVDTTIKMDEAKK